MDYDVNASVARIDEILDAEDVAFEEVDTIPARDRLTYTNGFYVSCSAVFVDLRDSSALPERYKRPTLARIYRSFLSECVAVMNANAKCSEVSIHGDAVWGVFDTPTKGDINSTFATVARLNTLRKILSCRFRHHGIGSIQAGIGVAYGRALMIKAGYAGSAISDVVWMGDVVNEASHLAGRAAKLLRKPILFSGVFRLNLTEENKNLTSPIGDGAFEADVVNVLMNDWWEENCQ